MQDTDKSQFPRRAFLQRATAVVGSTLLTVGATSTVAAALQKGGATQGGAQTPSVGYWNGKSFVSASELPFGDPGLGSVALTIQSFGPAGLLKTLDVNAMVPAVNGVQKVPFQAWVAVPSGSAEVHFPMTLDPQYGLVMTAHTSSGKAVSHTDFRLAMGSGDGMKLREGVYVITAETMNWFSYSYDPNNAESPLFGPAGPVTSLQYIVLIVSRT